MNTPSLPPRASRLLSARRSLGTVPRELDLGLDVAAGAVPRELRGALLRNGPGRMERGGHPYRHPFDGDGMIARFSLEGGRVHFRNRFVRTSEFEVERRADRPLFRSFGTNLPGGFARNALRVRFKNAANTSLVDHGGVLLALWEGGLPHRIDPQTLATLGRHDFDGALRSSRLPEMTALEAAVAPELPFSAHPRLDRATGDLFNFGTLMGMRPRLLIYRVTPAGHLSIDRIVPMDRLNFVHDFGVTPRYFVFHLSPVAFGMGRALLGMVPPAEALRGESGPGQLLLLPRDGGPAVTVPTSPGFCFHVANAFEDDAGRVIFDAMRAPRFPDLGALLPSGGEPSPFPAAYLTRFVVDPRHPRTPAREDRLSELPGELPSVHPTLQGVSHRFVYSVGSAELSAAPFYSSIVKHDAAERSAIVRSFGEDFPSEPVFVPRPGAAEEDDGWLLLVVYRSREHRSDLVVLAAGDLSEVALVRLPVHLPPLFHGIWLGARDGSRTSARS